MVVRSSIRSTRRGSTVALRVRYLAPWGLDPGLEKGIWDARAPARPALQGDWPSRCQTATRGLGRRGSLRGSPVGRFRPTDPLLGDQHRGVPVPLWLRRTRCRRRSQCFHFLLRLSFFAWVARRLSIDCRRRLLQTLSEECQMQSDAVS